MGQIISDGSDHGRVVLAADCAFDHPSYDLVNSACGGPCDSPVPDPGSYHAVWFRSS